MASSISPISDVISAPSNSSLIQRLSTNAATTATQSTSPTTSTTQAAATTATSTSSVTGASAQALSLVLDALASAGLDSAIDETLYTSPTAQAAGAYSIFLDQLLTALAAQQTTTAQAVTAQTDAGSTKAANANTATQQTSATQQASLPATATAAFAANSASATPNSALEGNVQALASQVQNTNATPSGTSNVQDADAVVINLQQSFDDLVASAGGSVNANGLPNFLQAFASNLHTVPSSLGNLVNSTT